MQRRERALEMLSNSGENMCDNGRTNQIIFSANLSESWACTAWPYMPAYVDYLRVSASTFSPIFRVVFGSKEKEQFWQIRDSSENSYSFILSRESPTAANKLRTAVSPAYFPYFEYVHVAPPHPRHHSAPAAHV